MASVSLASVNQSPPAVPANQAPPRKSLLRVVAEPLACLAILGSFLYVEPVYGIYYLAGAAAGVSAFTLRDKLKTSVESGDIEILKAQYEEIGKKIGELESKDSDSKIAELVAEHESAQQALQSAVQNAVNASQALAKMLPKKASEPVAAQSPSLVQTPERAQRPQVLHQRPQVLHQRPQALAQLHSEQLPSPIFLPSSQREADAPIRQASPSFFWEVPPSSRFDVSDARGPDVRTSSLRQVDLRTPGERRRIDEMLASLPAGNHRAAAATFS